MRSLRATYTIPAHLNNVADVRFFRSDGGIPAHIHSQQPPVNVDVEMASSAVDDMEKAGVKKEDEEKPSVPLASTPEQELEKTGVKKEDDEKPPVSSVLTPAQELEKLSEEWRYRSGLYLASAGYDGVVKIWSADDWQLLHTLQTDGSKVMSVDLSSDARMLASGTYSRNFQLYAPESAMSSL
jgi:U4/U6 small nuclear ribonucleoprotein PRP4